MPLANERLYHAAWVVDDLAAAMTSFGAVGLQWAKPAVRNIVVGRPNREPTPFSINVTYSCDGPLHVELIEGTPDSPWIPESLGRMHHLGWWVADLRATIGELERESHVLESWMVGDDGGPARFAYLRAPGGQRIEIVDEAIKPNLMGWLRGEEYA